MPVKRTIRPGPLLSSTRLAMDTLHSMTPSTPILPPRGTSNTDFSKEVQELMDNAVSKETLNRQHRQVDCFISFCVERGLQPEDISPPSESLLCEFAHSFAGKVAGPTVRAYITAIKKWVVSRGLYWAGGIYLEKTLKGVDNRTPASSIQADRAPVREEYLDILHAALGNNSQDPFTRCRNAAAFTMFYGQMRAGEALANSPEVSKYSDSLPRVKDLAPPNRNGARVLKLTKTKTQRVRGDQVILSPLESRSSPVWAIHRHIQVNRLQPEDPLFAYRSSDGSLTVMTKKEFLKSCNDVWAKHKIPKITGHCFRIGGTTHYLISGISPDVVKALGRWRSDAFLRYWRNIEDLAHVHLSGSKRIR